MTSHQTHEALNGLLFAIVDGEYDDALDRIIIAIKERRKAMREKTARLNMVTIAPGARVRLKGLSPKYLNGLEGKVTSTEGKTFVVALDDEMGGKYGNRKTVRVPAVCVEAA